MNRLDPNDTGALDWWVMGALSAAAVVAFWVGTNVGEDQGREAIKTEVVWQCRPGLGCVCRPIEIEQPAPLGAEMPR